MALAEAVKERYRANKNISSTQLKCLSLDELAELKEIVDQDLIHLAAQIERAKVIAASTGKYADPGWFSRAIVARRIKGQLSQRVQNEQGRRRREHSEKRWEEDKRSFGKRLLRAMDLVLTPEQKQSVVDKAAELDTCEV